MKAKILIVDDDLSIRIVLKKILSKYLGDNIDIYTSEDGVQGLGYAMIINPNLLIIDSTLPKYSGRELVDFLLTNSKFNNIPVIILKEREEDIANDLPLNYIQISKDSREFPKNLIERVIKILNNSIIIEGFGGSISSKTLNFLSSKIIRYSNESYLEASKLKGSSIFIKIFNSLGYIFHQVISGFYLTFFFILLGNKEREENIEQKRLDIKSFRSKVYPKIAITFAVFLFIFFQLVLIIGGILSVTLFRTEIVQAASYTWDGGGSDNNWSTCTNWSTDICPTSADSVTFSSLSTKNSIIDSGFTGSIASITINAGYSGTITMSRSLTVNDIFTTSGGIFNASNQNLSIVSTFTMNTGSTFTASSATTTFNAAITISGGTFNHNNGTVNISGTGGNQTLSCNNVTFNKVTITHSAGTKTISANCLFPLGNNPIITNGGNIIVNGKLSGSGTLTKSGNTLTLNGSSVISGFTGLSVGSLTINTVTMNFTSYTTFIVNTDLTVNSGTISLPNGANIKRDLEIGGGTFNAPSGNMSLSRSLTITGTPVFNHNNGTITLEGATATLSCNNVTFNKVIFASTGPKTIGSDCTLPLGNNPVFGPANITLNGVLKGSGKLNAIGGPLLTMNAGSSLEGFSELSLNAFTIAGASVDFSSYSSFLTSGLLTLSSGSLKLPNGADLNGTGAGSLKISGGTFNAPSGNMTIAGDLIISGTPTFNANGGTIIFDETSGTLSCNNVTFNKVIINNVTIPKVVSSNCTLPLGNNPTMSLGVTLSGTLSGTGTLTSGPNLTLSSGSTLSGFTGITMSSGDLTVSGANVDFSNYSTVDLNGSLILDSGTFKAPSGDMSVAGDFIAGSNNIFNANSGTIIFDGTLDATLACNSSTFNLVEFSPSSGSTKTVNPGCSLPLGTNPTITEGGNINLIGNLSGSGVLTKNSTVLKLSDGASLTGFNGLNVSDLISAATIDFSSYTSFITTGQLRVDSGELTLPPGADLNGALTINGGVFNAPSETLKIAGNMTISGGTFNHNNGTIIFDGTSGTLSCNNVTFNLISFTHTGTKTVNNDCSFPLGSNPSTFGSIILNGTLSGSGVITTGFGGSGNFTLNSGAILSGFNGFVNTIGSTSTINGAVVDFSNYNVVTFGSITMLSGTFAAPSSIMTVMENLIFTGGTFAHNGGTVILSSTTGGTIDGSIIFNNLTKTVTATDTLTFTAGTTQTVLGTLTLKGATGQLLNLRSSITGTQYSINATNINFEYLSIQDYNNTTGTVIQAAGKNVIDGGNNTGWNFDNPILTNIGPDSLTSGGYITTSTPTITFDVNDPNAGDTVKYIIQIDNNSDFSSPEVNYTSNFEPSGTKSYTTSNLTEGSYYLRFRAIDSNGGDSGYTTINNGNIAFKVDTVAPTGSILLDYVTDSTNPNIYIITNANDSGSGMGQMIYSQNSNFSGDSYISYQNSKLYSLTGEHGLKTIYIKFRDNAGNESPIYSANINYTQVTSNENTHTTPDYSPEETDTSIPTSYPNGSMDNSMGFIALKFLTSDKTPIANLQITFKDLNIKSITDENGIAIFEDIPLGKHEVFGVYNNKVFKQEVDISNPDKVITVVLQEDTNTLAIILGVLLIITTIGLIFVSFILYRKGKLKPQL